MKNVVGSYKLTLLLLRFKLLLSKFIGLKSFLSGEGLGLFLKSISNSFG